MTDETRTLGLLVRSVAHCVPDMSRNTSFYYLAVTLAQVCRGTAVMLVAPSTGMEEISNPFLQKDDKDGDAADAV